MIEFDPESSMNLTNIVGAIIAIITGGGLVKAFDKAIKWNDSRLRKRLPDVLADIDRIYEVMHELLRNSPADRILLVICTNGGGVPNSGKPIYSSVLREVSDGLDPVGPRWGKRMIDQEHVKMISELLDDGRVQNITFDMSGGGLSTLYRADGIWGDDMVLLHKGKKGLHYLVAHYSYEPTDANFVYEAKLNWAVSELQAIIPRID